MTELQKVEFEILKEFVRVCNELNLTYFLVCGSALGAAKYGGFIPWDDDIDVGMPRPDYDIFVEKAQGLLPEHLFLQNHKTDREYPLIFSKIRNSNTTFIETSLSGRRINHGIYIDVFPLDGYPYDKKSQRVLESEKKRYYLKRLCRLKFKPTWKTRLLVTAEKMLFVDKFFSRHVEKMVKRLSEYSVYDSQIWCNHGNWQGTLEYAPKEQYGNGALASFEGLAVVIPEKYDEYLTQKYGQWRNDLPDDQKEGHHYHTVCDCNKPYSEYVNY